MIDADKEREHCLAVARSYREDGSITGDPGAVVGMLLAQRQFARNEGIAELERALHTAAKAPPCSCHLEAGDSDCLAHPRCNVCGAWLEDGHCEPRAEREHCMRLAEGDYVLRDLLMREREAARQEGLAIGGSGIPALDAHIAALLERATLAETRLERARAENAEILETVLAVVAAAGNRYGVETTPEWRALIRLGKL